MDEIESLVLSLLEEFKIQHHSIASGNHRANNKSVDRAHKIFTELRLSQNVRELLPHLKTASAEVKASIAVYCLPVAEDKCLSILKEIRDNNDSILGLQAEYAVKNWENKQYFLWDD
ncbi:MAG: hypothetical protein AB8B56_02020 [Crocinitomicaceae bacterium]